MKAIILNSGVGIRMGALAKDKPKCLIEIDDGETILGWQLKSLRNNEINDVIITTGPFEDKIKSYIKKNFIDFKTVYVHNPKYDSTNYIYSLFLTRHLIDDDIVLMHGDLVFKEVIFKKLLKAECENATLINNLIEPPKKDFKGKIEEGIISEIGINIYGKNCFFLAPIYKFSRESFMLWLREIEKFVVRGEVGVYAENAFNTISSRIKLNPVYFSEELCMEIDNESDVKVARERLKDDTNL